MTGRIGGWWAVALLLVVYALAYVDRQILSLLVGPIRQDLAISDIQFSLLHGLSFALFYALLGMPIGVQVDRGHRPRILAAGVALWSLFTCLCGLSHRYWQLFLFRMGVGIGEATVVPVTYSLLGDYFTPRQRGLAMGLFGSGIYLGMGAALLIGGTLIRALETIGAIQVPYLGQLSSWQLALICVGAPGLPLALATLVLREPRVIGHVIASPSTVASRRMSSGRQALEHYRRFAPAILLHHLAVTFMVMTLYAVLAWAPEHFRRSYDVEPTASSVLIGLITIVAGVAGVIGGGALSDALADRRIRSARMVVLLMASLLAMPSVLLFSLAPNTTAALCGYAATIFFLSPLSSVGPTALQDLFPDRLRGRGAAVYQLVANLVGLGLGPTLVAAFTDYVFGNDLCLNMALAVTSLAILPAAAISSFLSIDHFQRSADIVAIEEARQSPRF